jgi:hypothetical protein
MKGEIAELLIYDVALSATNRDSVINYLKLKYNIINLPPTITLTSIPPGPAVNVGDIITLNALATDPDGSIAKVDFFGNGRFIGSASTNPYSFRASIESTGTVSFTAIATDNKDAATTSSAVTLTAAGTTAPSLTATNGLQLWLSADAGVSAGPSGGVTNWVDQSGNANNAMQTDETMGPQLVNNAANGKPVLRFDGLDDYFDVASSPGTAITGDIASFFVVKFDDFATYRAVWGKTFSNVPRPTDYYVLPGSGVPRAFRGSDVDGNAFVDGAGRFPTNTYLVVGFNQAGHVFTHHLNGAPFGSGRILLQPGDGATPLKIGTRDDFVTRMQGDIAEILIYNVALGEAQLKNVSSYLGSKYGVTVVVPTNTPPSVTITNPAGSGTFAAPTSITINASASDSDGSVARVDFYIGAGLVGSATSAPFSTTVDLPPAPGTLTLAAVATDNLGRASTSAPVTITVTASPITLPSAARLKLWLRADAGAITNASGVVVAWNDQSGNFHNASQSNPAAAPRLIAAAVNGKPTLRFDGADDQLSIPHAPDMANTGDLSTFFVVKFDDFATYRAVWAKTSGGFPSPIDYYLLPDSGIPRTLRGGFAAFGVVDGANPPPTNQYTIVGFDMEGTTLRHYLDGQENGTGEITNKIADAEAPLFIGTRGDLFTKMKGDVAEIVIYDLALSGTDRGAVFAYLANKYGISIGPSAPSLGVTRSGNSITISWPAPAIGFGLQSSDILPATTWTTVPFTPPPPGQDPSVMVTPTDGSVFYRLRKP